MQSESKFTKPFVSAFILFALLSSILWLVPDFDKKSDVVKAIRPFVSYLGFWQTNVFFGPDVPRVNIDLRARIACQNGTIINYNLPRLEELPLLQRIIKTPYRKYSFVYLKDENYKACRIDYVRYLARKLASATCTPASVTLECYSADVPPPEIGLHLTQLPPHSKREKLLEYEVKPEDLK